MRKLGFLTIGRFDEADPGPGHEQTLSMIERAEALGFDSVWLRHRHLQPGISSPVAIMAAATQRTSRIELGTAVIPLGLENPLRLAEDLATVDILSGGRINPGVSVGVPMLYDHFKTKLYPESHELENFSKDRVQRLLECLRGDPRQRLRGHDRHRAVLAPGAATLAGAGFPCLVRRGPVVGDLGRPAGHQLPDQLGGQHRGHRVARLRDHSGRAHRRVPRASRRIADTARVCHGLVVIPTDSASKAQIEKYRAYAAGRFERTKTPQGPRGMLFSPDYVGTSDELAETLHAHAGFQRADEVAFALPFTFDEDDYLQIVTDMAEKLGPKLGWTPNVGT